MKPRIKAGIAVFIMAVIYCVAAGLMWREQAKINMETCPLCGK